MRFGSLLRFGTVLVRNRIPSRITSIFFVPSLLFVVCFCPSSWRKIRCGRPFAADRYFLNDLRSGILHAEAENFVYLSEKGLFVLSVCRVSRSPARTAGRKSAPVRSPVPHRMQPARHVPALRADANRTGVSFRRRRADGCRREAIRFHVKRTTVLRRTETGRRPGLISPDAIGLRRIFPIFVLEKIRIPTSGSR